jgi:hypothetical protein
VRGGEGELMMEGRQGMADTVWHARHWGEGRQGEVELGVTGAVGKGGARYYGE